MKGLALIVGAGGIGTQIAKDLSESEKDLDVILCGRQSEFKSLLEEGTVPFTILSFVVDKSGTSNISRRGNSSISLFGFETSLPFIAKCKGIGVFEALIVIGTL